MTVFSDMNAGSRNDAKEIPERVVGTNNLADM